MSENWNICTGTNAFKHAEFKSEEFPLRRPAVFSQTVILSLLIHDNFVHCSTTRMDEDTRLHNSKWLIRVNQSPHLTKDRFAWVILSHVILSTLNVNNISSLQYCKGKDIAFQNHQFWLYVYKITRTLMSSHWSMSLDWEIIVYMRPKCIIQRCITVILCQEVSSHVNFQHSFWGVIQEEINHCTWTITLVGVILCDKRILLERELPYTFKSANKQLTHAFLHFVASLQRRFYTLAPISVLYMWTFTLLV